PSGTGAKGAKRIPSSMEPSPLQHAVADPRLVEDVFRIGRIVTELMAELADEDAEILRVGLVRLAPDRPQDVAVGEDAPGILRQHLEQVELLRRQLHRRSAEADL